MNNNKTKSNLAVASLINSTSGSKMSTISHEVPKVQPSQATSIQSVTKDVPTVANSALLYKTIPSHNTVMTPLLGTKSTVPLTISYAVQQIPAASTISNHSMTSIKPLTKATTNTTESTNLRGNHDSIQYQGQKPYVPILPASSFKGSVALTTGNLKSIDTKPPTVSKRNSNTTVVNMKSTSTRNVQNKKHLQDSSAIFVPRGWNRILEKEQITYVSPNKSRLRSMKDLIDYLQREGTCKCGLECPFKPDEVFNFNPKVQSCFGFLPNGVDSNREISCVVCKKFEELFPRMTKSKQSRGRKPGGKNKRTIPSETKNIPEPKKILLTGASPLEIFQTKMDAINASSSQFLLSFQQNKGNVMNTNNILKNSQLHSKSSIQLTNAAEETMITNSKFHKKATKRRTKTDNVKKTSPLPMQNNHIVSSAKNLIIGQVHGLIDSTTAASSSLISKTLSSLHNIPSSLIKGTVITSKATANLMNAPAQQVSHTNTVPQLPSQMSSKISPSISLSDSQEGRGQQQMLLLQLVNQSNNQSISTKNTQSSSSPILISSTPTLQTLALRKSQQLIATNSPKTLPVQYVVSPPTGYAIQQQPIIQYVSQAIPTVPILPSASKSIVKQASPVLSSYIRIAPATTPTQSTVVEITNPLEREEENQKRKLHASMLQAITGKQMNSQKVYETISAAQQFLSNVAKEEQKTTPVAASSENKAVNLQPDVEEMELECEESSSSLMGEKDEDKSSRHLRLSDIYNESNPSGQRIVWVHLPGFPNWPGKIISHTEAKNSPLKEGQAYVSMFLTNQIHAVTIEKQLYHFDRDAVQFNWESSSGFETSYNFCVRDGSEIILRSLGVPKLTRNQSLQLQFGRAIKNKFLNT